MAQHSFTIQVSDSLLRALGWSSDQVPARVHETLVMDALRADRISEAEAAQILGCLNRLQLLAVMGQHRIPAIRLTKREIAKEAAGLALRKP